LNIALGWQKIEEDVRFVLDNSNLGTGMGMTGIPRISREIHRNGVRCGGNAAGMELWELEESAGMEFVHAGTPLWRSCRR